MLKNFKVFDLLTKSSITQLAMLLYSSLNLMLTMLSLNSFRHIFISWEDCLAEIESNTFVRWLFHILSTHLLYKSFSKHLKEWDDIHKWMYFGGDLTIMISSSKSSQSLIIKLWYDFDRYSILPSINIINSDHVNCLVYSNVSLSISIFFALIFKNSNETDVLAIIKSEYILNTESNTPPSFKWSTWNATKGVDLFLVRNRTVELFCYQFCRIKFFRIILLN